MCSVPLRCSQNFWLLMTDMTDTIVRTQQEHPRLSEYRHAYKAHTHTHTRATAMVETYIHTKKKKQRTNCSHDVMSTIANLVLSQNHPKYFQNQGDRSFPIKSWSSHSLTFQWYARWRWVATLSSACFPWRNAWWPHGCTPLSHGAPTWNGSGNMGLGTPIAGWYL